MPSSNNMTKELYANWLPAQKLESLGRLAGGVAHDFNNMLTVILGFCDVALTELPPEHRVREYLEVIKDSGEKAAQLTQQLLAFGCKQVLHVQPICLHSIIQRVVLLLRRVITRDISIRLDLQARSSYVSADVGQIDQVVMNLVMNARDALSGSGDIYIRTYNATQILHGEETECIVFSVKDNGVGIAPEVKERIFEPFFTTKTHGAGTGLGLACVFGVVSQHKGFLEVESELGAGSTFYVYLPTICPISQQKKAAAANQLSLLPLGGKEKILVVDDEVDIRQLLVSILSHLGYHVRDAGSADEALALVRDHGFKPQVLLTDIRMPGMRGEQLAEKMRELLPKVQVLFMSGYTQGDEQLTQLLTIPSELLLQKPLNSKDLAQKLRDVLEK